MSYKSILFGSNSLKVSVLCGTWFGPPIHFKGGGRVNFDYLPQGGPENLKKGGGSMVQGQAFLKEWREWGGWHFSYLTFSSFIDFAFKNYFALCKILCI